MALHQQSWLFIGSAYLIVFEVTVLVGHYVNFVPGQVQRVYMDDKEIKLNHVQVRERILEVVYICIPHIVAISDDGNRNGEYPLDNQNWDKVFLDLALHSYSICVHQNHVSGQ